MQEDNADPKESVDARLRKLEAMVAALTTKLAQHDGGGAVDELSGRVDEVAARIVSPHPLRPYLIGEVTAGTGDRVAFKEKYATDSGLVDFASGRVVDDETTDYAAYIVPPTMGLLVTYDIPGGVRNAFIPAGNGISGLITSDGSEDGQYIGKSYVANTATASVKGTLVGSADCIIWDLAETGLSGGTGHDVTATPNSTAFALGFVGIVVGYDSDSGKKLVHGTVYWAAC